MAIITVDYYGTLNKHAVFWQKFLKYVILEGHKVYVLGGNWEIALDDGMKELGYKRKIHYHNVFSVLRILKDFGFDTWLDESQDSWYSQEDAWWPAKSHFCKEHGVSIHFDNDIRFAKSFADIPTRFVHTESAKGAAILKSWSYQLEIANTFLDEDDMFDYYGIGGIVPM